MPEREPINWPKLAVLGTFIVLGIVVLLSLFTYGMSVIGGS